MDHMDQLVLVSIWKSGKANWHRRCERKICTRWKPSLEVQWLVGLLLAGGELNPWIPTRRLIPLLATVPHTLPGPSSASPVLCVADIRDELVNESTRPQIWVNSHPGNGLHLARPPVLCVALIFHSGTWVGRYNDILQTFRIFNIHPTCILLLTFGDELELLDWK